MKASKEAPRAARKLFRLSLVDGKLDMERVKTIVAEDSPSAKPRGYLGIIGAYQRLLRLELDKHHAVIESATRARRTRWQRRSPPTLKKKYGDGRDHRIQGQSGPARRHARQSRQRRLGRQRQKPPRAPLRSLSATRAFPHSPFDRPPFTHFQVTQTQQHEQHPAGTGNRDRRPQDRGHQVERRRRPRDR